LFDNVVTKYHELEADALLIVGLLFMAMIMNVYDTHNILKNNNAALKQK